MNQSIDKLLGTTNKLLSRLLGGRGCDLVSTVGQFTSTKGLIHSIVSNEADSRIKSVTVSATAATGSTYMSVCRVDTITLAGASGTATIVCDAVTKTATFNGNLNTTASDFVTANAVDYLAAGSILTAVLNVLYFTSSVAGTDFTGASSGANASGDLAGTAATATANVVRAINDTKMIVFDTPSIGFYLSKGSFWVYYE